MASGLSLALEDRIGGPIPVVLLHDFDVSGRLLLEELASEITGRFHPVLIDLPGFGLSQRIPEPGDPHTVSSMAEAVGIVISERFELPVVIAGVGLGGQVAAEVALTNPDIVRGLVMIDADFSSDPDWVEVAEVSPYIGLAVVHTFEASGRFGVDRWAPRCDEGGWCPTADQVVRRDLAASVAGTTASLHSFLTTPRSSLVPSELGSISVLTAYVWSTDGPVPEESVVMISDRMPDALIIESDVWKAHLQDPDAIVDAINQVGR